jgi:hypothetical protein
VYLGLYVSPICSPSRGSFVRGESVSEDGIGENSLKRKGMGLDGCTRNNRARLLRLGPNQRIFAASAFPKWLSLHLGELHPGLWALGQATLSNWPPLCVHY